MNEVREKRVSMFYTQQDLAEMAGVSLRTIISVEAGLNCRDNTKRRITQAFVGPGYTVAQVRLLFPINLISRKGGTSP